MDVIERGPGYAIDDMVVDLPQGRLADSLVSAAATVAGVKVESIRTYASTLDTNRELELIDALVTQPDDGLTLLADGVTRIFRAGWALVLAPPADGTNCAVLARSTAAPELETIPAVWWPLTKARALSSDEAHVPGAWTAYDTELAGSPLNPNAVLIGRPAMRWLPGELARFSHLCGILASILPN